MRFLDIQIMGQAFFKSNEIIILSKRFLQMFFTIIQFILQLSIIVIISSLEYLKISYFGRHLFCIKTCKLWLWGFPSKLCYTNFNAKILGICYVRYVMTGKSMNRDDVAILQRIGSICLHSRDDTSYYFLYQVKFIKIRENLVCSN